MNKYITIVENGNTLNATYCDGKEMFSETMEIKKAFSNTAQSILQKVTGINAVSTKAAEPPVETKPEPPKHEPIKLYCVKSKGFFQEGKTYTIESDGTLMLERGYEDNHKDFAEVLRVHPQLTGKIFPLVSRPALIGEWVYVEKQNDRKSNLHNYDIGQIYKVFYVTNVDGIENRVYFALDGNGNVEPDSYLVLDGYKEEEKPKYCERCGKEI